MKSMDKLVEELSVRLQQNDVCYGIGTMYLQYDPDVLARWILTEYRPPIEWEETPGDYGSHLLSIRTVVAGRVFKQTSRITEEMRRRGGHPMNSLKDHLRRALGREVYDFLDGTDG